MLLVCAGVYSGGVLLVVLRLWILDLFDCGVVWGASWCGGCVWVGCGCIVGLYLRMGDTIAFVFVVCIGW